MSDNNIEPTQDDDPDQEAIPELHLYFPRVRCPPRKKLEMFAKEFDIEIIHGKFSAKEDKRIIRNFARFCKKYDLTDCSLTRCALLGFAIEDEDEEHVKEFLRIKEYVRRAGFYYWLARKLPNRLIVAVYNRAKKLLHPFRKQSELTQSEKLEIIDMAKSMKKCKNMYSKIGNIYDCAPRAAQKIIGNNLNSDENITFNKGKWQPVETLELVKAILEHYEIDIDNLTEDHLRAQLPWNELSKKVVTRSPDSCGTHIPTVANKLNLIKKDYKLYYRLRKY